MSQLVGYSKAKGVPVGGWWVVNKANGNFKYISASGVDVKEEMEKIEDTIDYINNDEPFERCYEPVAETYYGKPSGNMKLGIECSYARTEKSVGIIFKFFHQKFLSLPHHL